MTNTKAQAEMLRASIEKNERDTASNKIALETLYRSCVHVWDEKIVYSPIVHKGYTIPADPPDRRMPMHRFSDYHVPNKVTPRWIRTCTNCGFGEETRETGERVTRIPTFKKDQRY